MVPISTKHPIRNLLLMAVVFNGLNPWPDNFPSESWDLEFCPNFALFSFNPNTFHSHFNCVLKALSICSFSYLKAASYKRVRCVPMFPNLKVLREEVPVFSSDQMFTRMTTVPLYLVRPDRLTSPPWAQSATHSGEALTLRTLKI